MVQDIRYTSEYIPKLQIHQQSHVPVMPTFTMDSAQLKEVLKYVQRMSPLQCVYVIVTLECIHLYFYVL